MGSHLFCGCFTMSAVVVAFLQLTTPSRSYGQSFGSASSPGTPGFIPIVVNNSPGSVPAAAPPSSWSPSAVASSIFNTQGQTPVGSLPSAGPLIQTPTAFQQPFQQQFPQAPTSAFAPGSAVAGSPGSYGTSSILQPAGQPGSTMYRPSTSNLDLLSGYATDFLTSLNRDQLTAFLRVYFLSRMVGASMLDQRSSLALQRSGVSVAAADLRAIDTARSIPTSEVQMAGLESTGLGQVLNSYAARLRSASSSNERLALAREYQNTVDTLSIPKGLKYALKHIV